MAAINATLTSIMQKTSTFKLEMSVSTTSLQNLCLFKLVHELEYYSPEILACLPPTLRRLLLVHLPIIDICKLTNTCVFDGIDPESIWERIYQRQFPRYFASDEVFRLCDLEKNPLKERNASFRERYLSLLARIVLNCARPTGYFAVRNVQDHDSKSCERCNDLPPKSFLTDAPVDIVNTLIAGERITTTINEDETGQEEAAHEQDVSIEDEVDNCVFKLFEDGDVYVSITAVTDYYKDNQLELSQNHCALVDDHDWDHDHEDERKDIVLGYCSYKETNRLYQYVPPRYSVYTHEDSNYRLSDDDAITLLMNVCHYHPEHVSINTTAYGSKDWSPKLLSDFLSKTVSLRLFFDGFFEESQKKPLTTILSNPTPVLSCLELESDTSNHSCLPSRDNQLAYVENVHLAYLAKLAELPSGCGTSLCMLRELSVHGRFTADGLTNIAKVIGYQNSLSSFSLHSFNEELLDYFFSREACVCNHPFVDALVLLFHSSSFEKVTLKGITFPLDLLQDVISGYLTASCIHAQTLTLESNIVLEEDVTRLSTMSKNQNLAIPESASEYKSLVLSVRELECAEFNTWLFALQPLKLNNLTVSCHHHFNPHVCDKYEYNFLRQTPMDTVANGSSTNFQVRSLSLCQPTSISANPDKIQMLLKNKSLKSLTLTFCKQIIDYSEIAELLIKPLSQSRLENLKIDVQCDYLRHHNNIISKEAITHFSDALSTLPNLGHLTLEHSLCDIANHDLVCDFITIMYESWKNIRRQKFKNIIVNVKKSSMCDCEHCESAREMASEMGLDLHIVLDNNNNYYI